MKDHNIVMLEKLCKLDIQINILLTLTPSNTNSSATKISELGIDFTLLNSTKLLLVEGVFGKQRETSTWEQQSASCNICTQMKVIQYIKKTLYCTNRCTQSINPFTSKILFLILLTLCHTLLIMIL